MVMLSGDAAVSMFENTATTVSLGRVGLVIQRISGGPLFAVVISRPVMMSTMKSDAIEEQCEDW